MTENEWFDLGEIKLQEWRDYIDSYGTPGLSSNEENAFLLGWEQAGRQMGYVD